MGQYTEKQEVFDAHIKPLMEQVTDLCQQHDIAIDCRFDFEFGMWKVHSLAMLTQKPSTAKAQPIDHFAKLMATSATANYAWMAAQKAGLSVEDSLKAVCVGIDCESREYRNALRDKLIESNTNGSIPASLDDYIPGTTP